MATWTNESKTIDYDFLLMETEDFLLLETGDRIILEEGDYNNFEMIDDRTSTTFTNVSKNSTSYTNQSRN